MKAGKAENFSQDERRVPLRSRHLTGALSDEGSRGAKAGAQLMLEPESSEPAGPSAGRPSSVVRSRGRGENLDESWHFGS